LFAHNSIFEFFGFFNDRDGFFNIDYGLKPSGKMGKWHEESIHLNIKDGTGRYAFVPEVGLYLHNENGHFINYHLLMLPSKDH
jgi:hypothetical protein